MSIKRKEQLKNAQKRYRESRQRGCSRINLYISETAHRALKQKANQLRVTQAQYLDLLLLDNAQTSHLTEKAIAVPMPAPDQAVFHVPSQAEVVSLDTQVQQMKKELEKKNYWIERLTAVNEALNYQSRELEDRIKQLQLEIKSQ